MDREKKRGQIDAESAAELSALSRGAATNAAQNEKRASPISNLGEKKAKSASPEARARLTAKSAKKAAKKYAPAALYGAFCAAISSVGFVFGTYPFGFAMLCAAEGREYVAAALAGIFFGSLLIDGGGFVTLAALVVASARFLLGLVDRRRSLRSGASPRSSEDEVFVSRSDASPDIASDGEKVVCVAERAERADASAGKGASTGGAFSVAFDEELPVRCALAAAGAIVIGGVGLLFHANVWRALAALVLSAAVAPVFCAAFSGFFKNGTDFVDPDPARDRFEGVSPVDPADAELARRRRRSAWSASALAVLFCVSWMLSGVVVGSIRLGAAFALLFSLVSAHFLSLPEAAFVSLVLSLPLDFAVIPAVMLAACAYSTVRRHFPLLAAAAGGATAIFFSLGAMGISAASRYGGAFILASALSVVTARTVAALPDRLPGRVGERIRVILGTSAPAQKSASAALYEPCVRELRSLSDCFKSLGTLAKGISRALAAPSEAQIRERVSRTFERRCAYCDLQAKCWASEEHADYRRALARAVRRGEGTSSVAVSPEIARRCAALPTILRAISPESDAGVDPPAVFARDFEQLGAMLDDASEKLGAENAYDEAASISLRRELTKAGVFANEVSVVSARLRLTRISGVDPASFPSDAASFRRLVGRALGCEMTEPRISVVSGGLDISLRAKEKFRVVMGKCSVSATNAPCGDSASAFVSRDGYFRAVLSDGMGSGTEAAFTAGTVTLFLERLLSAGVRMASALRITNSFLRDRQIECSATVDVAEIDLVGNGAHFFKSGAAPSFVLRGKKLFKLRSRTVPIGILSDADAEAISFDVLPGDVIVMTSDGVTRDSEDCPWLYDALCAEQITELTSAARRIADEAKRRSSDDVTVMLFRVESA